MYHTSHAFPRWLVRGGGGLAQPNDVTGYFSQDLLPIYDPPKEGSLPSESPTGGGASHTQTGGG